MKGSGNKEDPLIIYSDNEEEYDTTNKHSADSKSITGATICGSRSPTYTPASNDNTVEGYCLNQSLIVETMKNPIIKDSSATEVFDMVNQQRNHNPKNFVSSMIMGKNVDEGEGGCSARALKSLNVFKTVKLAKDALNIQIAAVEEDFCNRRKNNISIAKNQSHARVTDLIQQKKLNYRASNGGKSAKKSKKKKVKKRKQRNNLTSAGITDEEWHVETIKRTICSQGFHFKRLESNIGHINCVDLNEQFKKGSYFVIGTTNNQWYNEHGKKQPLKFPDYAADHPGKNARLWVHAIAIKNGKVFDQPTTTTLGSLWIKPENNMPDRDKGIMRMFHKVWRVYKCTKQNTNCRGQCCHFPLLKWRKL